MRFVLLVITGLLMLPSNPVHADNMACGLKPLPPLGCSSSSAVCLCDASGACKWVFSC